MNYAEEDLRTDEGAPTTKEASTQGWRQGSLVWHLALSHDLLIHDRYILRGRERATTYSWLCNAVITTVFTMSSTVQPRERSFTGFARPCMMGPTAMVFDACWTAL